MKILYCDRCGDIVMYVIKAEIKKGTILICKKCQENERGAKLDVLLDDLFGFEKK
jgi:DNA-directed RNA polymerase subunit M/transcription elongation factor TFIIS